MTQNPFQKPQNPFARASATEPRTFAPPPSNAVTAHAQPLTPQAISKVIPGSIGSIDEIAKRLGLKRIEVSRFVAQNPELKELIEDERQAAIERVMKQQYDDAMDGNSVARESFIKMANGFFSKDDKRKDTGPQTKIVIQMDAPPKTVKSFDPDTGGIIDLDPETLLPVGSGDNSGDEDNGDDGSEQDAPTADVDEIF